MSNQNKSLTISWNQGNSAINMVNKNFDSFKQFCEKIQKTSKSKLEKGSPINWYFVRGEIDPEELHRNNENLLKAHILFIDLDSKPDLSVPPNVISNILDSKNINHIIQTSSSHKPEKPKYHVLVPCVTDSDEECKRATDYLVHEILGIENCDGLDERSYVWSQPVYLSTGENVTYFGKFDGDDLIIPDKYEPPTDAEAEAEANTTTTGAKTQEELDKDYEAGHRHGPISKLSMSLANKGFSVEDIIKQVMERYPGDDYKHYEQSAKTAVNKVARENEESDVENPLEVLKQMYSVTENDVKNIGEDKWIIDNLLIEGHILTLIAEGGGGKTSILVHLAPEMVKAGYEVFYINLDSPYSDYKRYHKLAFEGGYKLLAPDVKGQGKSIDGMLKLIDQISKMDDSLKEKVFIFDTLKKCVDMMHKGQIKDFFAMLRRMTARGASVVLLGHANKKRDHNWNLVYEGTGDVRNDTDELLVLEYMDDGDNRIVSTYVDSDYGAKVRGVFNPLTFVIDKKTRDVTRSIMGHDVRGNKKIKQKLDEKSEITDFLVSFITDNEGANQGEILDACKAAKLGISACRTFLKMLCFGPENVIKFKEVKAKEHPYPKQYFLLDGEKE